MIERTPVEMFVAPANALVGGFHPWLLTTDRLAE
jgi:hypothetical protein